MIQEKSETFDRFMVFESKKIRKVGDVCVAFYWNSLGSGGKVMPSKLDLTALSPHERIRAGAGEMYLLEFSFLYHSNSIFFQINKFLFYSMNL